MPPGSAIRKMASRQAIFCARSALLNLKMSLCHALSLSDLRRDLILNAPASVSSALPDIVSDPAKFFKLCTLGSRSRTSSIYLFLVCVPFGIRCTLLYSFSYFAVYIMISNSHSSRSVIFVRILLIIDHHGILSYLGGYKEEKVILML